MLVEFEMDGKCEDELILSYLQHHLKKQGVSEVLIEENNLMLKNRFFNTQSRMNPFAYVKDGQVGISRLGGKTVIYYKYRNFSFPLYLCLVFVILAFFERLFIFLSVMVVIIFISNLYLYHFKQKRFIRKRLEDFCKGGV